MLTPQITDTDITLAIDALEASPAATYRAAIRAVNRVGQWLMVRGARGAAAEMGIPVGAFKKGVEVNKANKSRPEFTIFLSRGRGIRNAARGGRARQTRKGVVVGKRRYDGAFLAKMPNMKQPGVFQRVGCDRFPIRAIYITIGPMLRKHLSAAMQTVVLDQIHTEFERQLKYELSR